MAFTKKLFLPILVIFILHPFTFAQSNCPKKLKVGWETAKPFQFLENGKVNGLDVEVFTLVMNSLGCPFQFEEIPWERHLKEVENGQTDVAMGASITPERKKWGLFSIPYSGEAVYLYGHKDHVTRFQFKNERELADLKIKIGVIAGSYLGDEFDQLIREKKLIKNVNLFEFTSEKQLIDLLLTKRIDGFLYGGVSLNFHKQIAHHPQKMFEHEAFFMFSKKTVQQTFIDRFNAELAKFKKDKSVEKIVAQYTSNKNQELYK